MVDPIGCSAKLCERFSSAKNIRLKILSSSSLLFLIAKQCGVKDHTSLFAPFARLQEVVVRCWNVQTTARGGCKVLGGGWKVLVAMGGCFKVLDYAVPCGCNEVSTMKP
ncbi:hypothetical protein L3X38_030674 [Prunus dulcis]|uniref:Uncharacterized protein n=1 Tax=Prunus dulcis TaxID=3755 RepID=A0AAD4VB33_PRUDU|nr:hypothetical protein L3X38_030674 [Prunus dulcis]